MTAGTFLRTCNSNMHPVCEQFKIQTADISILVLNKLML
jgi:hypothetical protein